jgi:hypothetical protein
MKIASVLLLMIGVATAQVSISPVRVECGLNCKGQFKIINSTTRPLAAVITIYSFTVAENGSPILQPVQQSTKVKLENQSARISPMGDFTFYYDIQCDQEPCMTELIAGMPVGRSTNGVDIWIRLPHLIFSCKKQKGCHALAVKNRE